ncbi:hypothetical protein K402DRAFT_394511 [Aulographum hederae CBS 113979]|uniref:BZIP domain-containing protein n=1 Tax=Aulographum hederae CBS 113979 TaxID=1176131 RepID=A0A6G1GXN3_9PEZI|nr:hypothetical protein K402DRAFT_394511 [Aulographum hederae CBS 113979]
MTSSESETRATRKRPRRSTKSASSEAADESKKQRGRPRVEANDENAADRRRTQIRLAQRAYRQRKETTITSLKKQVTDLQATVDSMNKAFLDFNDRAVSSGLLSSQPSLARELKGATEQFIQLTKAAHNATGFSEEEDDQEVADVEPASRKRTKATQKASSKHQAAQPTPSPDAVPASEEPANIGWGYSAAYDSSESSPNRLEAVASAYLPGMPLRDAAGMLERFQSPNSTNHIPLFPFRSFEQNQGNNENSESQALQQYHTILPSPPAIDFDVNLGDPIFPNAAKMDSTHFNLADSIFPNVTKMNSIQAPYTYSFQETNFGRRLHRAALERAYHLVANSHLRPNVYQRVFKLTLLYMNRDDILAKFKRILVRGTMESLENWQVPFIHLGGAGTHYPPKDADGNIQPIPNAYNVRMTGPSTLKTAKIEKSNPFMSLGTADGACEVNLEGWEGEWFDPHDVEGYLKEKGIVVQPQSSFAEAEISAADFVAPVPIRHELPPVPGSPANSTGALTVAASNSSISTPTTPEIDQNNFNQNGMDFWDDALNVPDMNAPGWFEDIGFDQLNWLGQPNNDSDVDFLMEGVEMPKPEPLPKKHVIIDVDKLINELVKRGSCLGRAPGFRRKDVDFAFNAAIIHN